MTQTKIPAKYYIYEKAFIGLGFLCGVLSCRENIYFATELLLVTIFFVFALRFVFTKETVVCEKSRMAFCFAYIFYIYQSVTKIVDTIGITTKDSWLLFADELILGKTPALWMENWISSLCTDFFCSMYITYDIYLAVALLWGLRQPIEKARKLAHYLFIAFFCGFIFYIAVPAVGPFRAFPEIFTVSLGNSWFSTTIFNFVLHAAPGYDVFPSLHIMILLILLDYDRKECPRRFYCMIVPSFGIFLSTMYLRYHYAIDIIVAIILFVIIRIYYNNLSKKLQGLD